MMMNSNQLDECVAYFKGKPGYDRLFVGMKGRYISLGRAGGSVELWDVTQEEKDALEGFLGKRFDVGKFARIEVPGFRRALKNSRFYEVSLEDLLHGYFGNSLRTNTEERQKKKQEEDSFFHGMIESYQGTFSGRWLDEAFLGEQTDFKYIRQKYREDKEEITNVLPLCMEAGNHLPVFTQKETKFPVFAAQISGNPHFFDEGRAANKILMYIVEYYYKVNLQKSTFNFQYAKAHLEKRNEAFLGVGLMKDDISNYTLLYKINGRKKNGSLHQGMAGFYMEDEPVAVPLLTINDLESVEITGNDIFVFENPMVFRELIGEGRPMVCVNGQPRLSTLILLDICVRSGYNLYYAGDFDAEGLRIAQNLKKRYPDNLKLLGYNKAYYEIATSNVEMSMTQFIKLKAVNIPELQEIKELLLETKRSGYQESLIEEYRKSLVNEDMVVT